MQYNKVFIFGVGGHARVLLSEISQFDKNKLVIFVASSEYENHQITINNKNYPVINNYSDLETQYDDLSCGLVGIGSIEKRISIVSEVDEILPSFNWMTMISKNSIVAKDAEIK